MKLNQTAINWLKENSACSEGFTWASKECTTLAEVVATARPDWAIWVYTRPGVLDDRTLWLFACWCAEQSLVNWYKVYPEDHRPKQAIEARRGWLEGTVTDEELSAAWSAALSAVESAARSVAWSAVESAARSAVESAAWSAVWSAVESAARSAALSAVESAARSVAWSVVRSAAWSAARSAAWSAAWSAVESVQANWLRENATAPNFVDKV